MAAPCGGPLVAQSGRSYLGHATQDRGLLPGILATSVVEELAGVFGPKGRNEAPWCADAFGRL